MMPPGRAVSGLESDGGDGPTPSAAADRDNTLAWARSPRQPHPVAGHIGLTPQSVNVMGGYKVQGKDLSGVEQLMRDAVALDRAGVACIYLEGIPREVAAMITAEVKTPTIGIGAGPDCDGQVLVFHDLLNLSCGRPAKFVRRYADVGAAITGAVQEFRADVASRQYPSDEESYHLPKETRAALETVLERKRAMRR